jgi:PAS domain S-box-containing protein
MALDIRTLIFVLGLTHVIQFGVFLHQYRVNRAIPGVVWWLLWSGVEVLAFASMLLRGIPALQTAAIITQNGLLILGVIFFYVGILRFFGRQENRRRLFAGYAVYLAGLAYFLFGQDDYGTRGVLISTALATLAFLSARALLAQQTRATAASANFLAAVCCAHGGHFVYRLGVQWAAPPPADFYAPSWFNAMPLLDGILVGLLWTFGVVLMISQRLNAEMKEAKEEIELIFNTVPDATLISRLNDGLIVSINDGFVALSGWQRPECIGQTTLAVNIWQHPADRQAVVAELQARGRCRAYEATFRRKDGSELIGLLSAVVFNLKDVPHVLSMIHDITARRRAEVELRQRAEALRAKHAELEFFNRAMVGREMRMIELKQEINALCQRLGEPPRHAGPLPDDHVAGVGPGPAEGEAP